MSIYPKDGDKLGDTNLAILTELAAVLGAIRGPWIVGGDWNLTPDMLASSNWLQVVGGVIRAPAAPTCHAHTYDYFVLHRSLESAVVAVTPICDGGCSPHWPARLYLHGALRHKAVRRLVKPDKIPGALPLGPIQFEPSRDGVAVDRNTEQLHQAFDS